MTAFKKGRLTFASLKWRVGGIITALPTLTEILSITEGDGCWLVFGSLKNDAFGEFFGSKPSWLPFSSVAARNACRSLAALTTAALRAGLTAATAPLKAVKAWKVRKKSLKRQSRIGTPRLPTPSCEMNDQLISITESRSM